MESGVVRLVSMSSIARLCFLLCVLIPVAVHAAMPNDTQATQLEIGLGIGALRFPDYPGADEHRTLLLPFPYIIYHSRYLDVNHDQVRGKLLSGKRFSLDVDFAGSVAVDSSRDQERQGMPNLGWIGEAGPALRYKAWSNQTGNMHISVVLPVRIAVSAEALNLHHRGEVFEPRLELVKDIGDGDRKLNIGTSLAVLYGSRDYFQYIYGVPPQYTTLARPAYNAPAGYGGYRISLGGSLHRGNIVYGAFIAYVNLNGAAFVNSPLVSRTQDLSFGIMVAWIFKRSNI